MFKLWRYCVQMKLKFDLFIHNEMIIYLTFLHDSYHARIRCFIEYQRWILIYVGYYFILNI